MSNGHSNDSTKHVQVAPALMIVKPLHVASVDHKWLFEVGQQIRCQVVASGLENLLVGGALVGRRAVVAVGHLALHLCYHGGGCL